MRPLGNKMLGLITASVLLLACATFYGGRPDGNGDLPILPLSRPQPKPVLSPLVAQAQKLMGQLSVGRFSRKKAVGLLSIQYEMDEEKMKNRWQRKPSELHPDDQDLDGLYDILQYEIKQGLMSDPDSDRNRDHTITDAYADTCLLILICNTLIYRINAYKGDPHIAEYIHFVGKAYYDYAYALHKLEQGKLEWAQLAIDYLDLALGEHSTIPTRVRTLYYLALSRELLFDISEQEEASLDDLIKKCYSACAGYEDFLNEARKHGGPKSKFDTILEIAESNRTRCLERKKTLEEQKALERKKEKEEEKETRPIW